MVKRAEEIILKIDDYPNILEFKFPNGIPIWLTIRNQVYTSLYNNFNKEISGYLEIKQQEKSRYKIWKDKIIYFFLSFWHSPFFKMKQYDCLNFCSTVGMVQTQEGYLSRISGFLTEYKFKTLNIIKSNKESYYGKFKGEFCFLDYLFLKAAFKKKFKKKQLFVAQEISEVICIIKAFTKYSLSETDFRKITLDLSFCWDISKDIYKEFKYIIEHTKPKVIFIEDGNYGGLDSLTLCKIAYDMKIKTVEIQHGLIVNAYRYSNRIVLNPCFDQFKTQYFFTFGKYFSEQIRFNCEKIDIGYSYLFKKKQCLKGSDSKMSSKTILFITQHDYTDGIIPILHKAINYLEKRVTLVVRLHPADLKGAEKYTEFKAICNLRVSQNEDLYQEIIDADIVIGSYSLVLFETVFFGKVPFIHKNTTSDQFIPSELGIRFSNEKELKNLMSSNVVFNTNVQEKFWTMDFDRRITEAFQLIGLDF